MALGNEIRYELVRGWQPGYNHNDVADVVTDADGRVFLFARGAAPVVVYDRDGGYLDSWGIGAFSYRTHGMHLTGEGLLLVDDDGASVTRYGLDGTLLQTIGPAGVRSAPVIEDGEVVAAAGPYHRPTNAALGPDGRYYVSDGYSNARIHTFAHDGTPLDSWGGPGRGPGEFRTPHSIWAKEDGTLLVADRENDRIQFFDAEGQYLHEWTDVQRPQDIYIDDQGLVYVAEIFYTAGERAGAYGQVLPDSLPARVSIFDAEGNLLSRWSGQEEDDEGFLYAPHGIWVDHEGSIYVTEVVGTIAAHRREARFHLPAVRKYVRR